MKEQAIKSAIKDTIELAYIKSFFKRAGINKSGICKEAGIVQQNLNRVLYKEQKLTKSLKDKLLPVIKKYGYSEM